MGKVFKACLVFLYLQHAKRRVLVFDPQVFNQTRLAEYQRGCASVGCMLPTVCGFVDGTCDPIARPYYGGYNGDAQRAVYSGIAMTLAPRHPVSCPD